MIRPESDFAKWCVAPTWNVQAYQGMLCSFLSHSHGARRWGLIVRLWDGSYTTFLVLVSWAFFSGSTDFTWMSVCDVLAGGHLQTDRGVLAAARRSGSYRPSSNLHPLPLPAGAIYTLDVFLNLHIGYVLSKAMRQRLLMDGRQVAHLYLYHGTLIVDVLAIIPVVPEARRGTLACATALIPVGPQRHCNDGTSPATYTEEYRHADHLFGVTDDVRHQQSHQGLRLRAARAAAASHAAPETGDAQPLHQTVFCCQSAQRIGARWSLVFI